MADSSPELMRAFDVLLNRRPIPAVSATGAGESLPPLPPAVAAALDAVMTADESPAGHARCDRLETAVREALRDTAAAQRAEAQREMDEADRRAGAAERRLADAVEANDTRQRWLRNAKIDAGYHPDTSFDVVWRDALAALRRERAASPHLTTVDAPPADAEAARDPEREERTALATWLRHLAADMFEDPTHQRDLRRAARLLIATADAGRGPDHAEAPDTPAGVVAGRSDRV